MFRVICTLPNASDNINGIPFVSREPDPGVISVDVVDAEVAENFASIPGYQLAGPDGVPADYVAPEPAEPAPVEPPPEPVVEPPPIVEPPVEPEPPPVIVEPVVEPVAEPAAAPALESAAPAAPVITPPSSGAGRPSKEELASRIIALGGTVPEDAKWAVLRGLLTALETAPPPPPPAPPEDEPEEPGGVF